MNDGTQAREMIPRPWLVWLDGELFGDYRSQPEQLAAVTEAAAAGGEVSTSHWDPEGYTGPGWTEPVTAGQAPRPTADEPAARSPVSAARKEQQEMPDSENPFPGLTEDQARRWAAVQPAVGFPPGLVGDEPGRARLVSGLRALADYLESAPAVPVQPYGVHIVVHAQGTDSEMKAQVDLVGEILGAPPDEEDPGSGHYEVRQSFGPVTYKFLAISDERMARHAAFMSYAQSVEPDFPAGQPPGLAATAFPVTPPAQAPAGPRGRTGEAPRRIARKLAR